MSLEEIACPSRSKAGLVDKLQPSVGIVSERCYDTTEVVEIFSDDKVYPP
jgi:hypothetical protein